MKLFSTFTLIVGMALCAFNPTSVLADDDTMTLEEYRAVMVRCAEVFGAEVVLEKMQDLTVEEWQAMYDATPKKWEFAEAVIGMEQADEEGAAIKATSVAPMVGPLAIDVGEVVEGEFEPRYAEWVGAYALYMDPLGYILSLPKPLGVDLGDLQPFYVDEDEPGLQDDRSKENRVAMAAAVHTTVHTIALGLDSIPVAKEIASILDFWIEEYIATADVHDGNVNGAEIEAAYENSRTILSMVNGLDAHLGDETNFVDDEELALAEANIVEAVQTYAEAVMEDIEEHDDAIKDALSTHDDEVKAALAAHDAKIEARLDEVDAKLDYIVELLKTPQGLREGWNDKDIPPGKHK